jgi:hypothetical protein
VSVRFCLVPEIVDANGYRRPKYFDTLGVPEWNAMDYGLQPVFLVVSDLTQAQVDSLTANPDVTAVPLNLDNTVGANLATVQSALEALNIPGNWITSGNTYREVLKVVAKIFRFMQRFHALNLVALFGSGITLDTTISQLTAAQKLRLTNTSDNLGLDRSAIVVTTTIRQALKIVGDQLNSIRLAGQKL